MNTNSNTRRENKDLFSALRGVDFKRRSMVACADERQPEYFAGFTRMAMHFRHFTMTRRRLLWNTREYPDGLVPAVQRGDTSNIVRHAIVSRVRKSL